MVEMILYMGILLVLITALATIFGSTLSVQLESQATSSVDQDSKYILSRLTYDMQSASAIVSPLAGQQGSVLQISVNAITYTYGLDGNGNLRLTNNSGSYNLNSNNSAISNLTFQRIGRGDTNDTVQVKFTVTSRINKVGTAITETKNFQTTLGLK